MRNYRGSDYNGGYPLTELTLQDFKHILNPTILAQLIQYDPGINGHIQNVHRFGGVNFNGNLGDFANARDAIEIVEYLVSHNVPVMINTNGSLRNSAWWARLALPKVTIGFAIDGLADTHHLYRQDTDWHRIIEHAQAFIAAGGKAGWRFVPFEHNQHQEQECHRLAKEMGFVYFENIYDGRDRGPVFDRDGVFSHWLGPVTESEKYVPEINNLLQGHITWYNKNSKFEKDTEKLNMQCMHKRNREIYLAADGTVYPCCFLGFYPKTMNHPGNQELAPLIKENNALEYDLEHCLDWFDSVEETWQKESIAQGRLYQCVNTCNKV
jgi:sulfatase maturation enzyme AslB (radical SAM superfamily)